MVQLVSSSGTVTKTYKYDAFGVEYTPDANDTNYFRYCGQYFDTESGTYYLRARYYDPATGRFTQQDGCEFFNYGDPLSLNLYSYCKSDPITYLDPSGNIATYNTEMTDGGGSGISDPDADEFGKDSDTYKILQDIKNRINRTDDESEKERLLALANQIREMHRNGKPAVYSQNKIENFLTCNAEYMKKLGESFAWYNADIKLMVFAALVKNNAKYDIKRKSEWQNPYKTGDAAMSTPFMYFDGMLLSAEDVGNLCYGYLGSAYGYSSNILCFGAGFYQIITGGSDWTYLPFFFDEPVDNFFIRLGAYYYNNGF